MTSQRAFLSLSGVCFFISEHIPIIYYFLLWLLWHKREYKSIYKERYIKRGNSGLCQSVVIFTDRVFISPCPPQVPPVSNFSLVFQLSAALAAGFSERTFLRFQCPPAARLAGFTEFLIGDQLSRIAVSPRTASASLTTYAASPCGFVRSRAVLRGVGG